MKIIPTTAIDTITIFLFLCQSNVYAQQVINYESVVKLTYKAKQMIEYVYLLLLLHRYL